MARYHFFTKVLAVAFILAMFAAIAPAGHASADTGSSAASTTNKAPVLSSSEQYLLDHINAARQAAGLGKVTINPQLETLARSRSTDMATRNYFSHYTPEGKTFIDMINALNIAYTNIGEIINRNSYSDADSPNIAFTSFMNSPLHKSYIMTSVYTDCGVGEVTAANGIKYYTVIFLAN